MKKRHTLFWHKKTQIDDFSFQNDMCGNFLQCAFPLRKSAAFDLIEFWTQSLVLNEFLIKSIRLPFTKSINFHRFFKRINSVKTFNSGILILWNQNNAWKIAFLDCILLKKWIWRMNHIVVLGYIIILLVVSRRNSSSNEHPYHKNIILLYDSRMLSDFWKCILPCVFRTYAHKFLNIFFKNKSGVFYQGECLL